MTKVMLFGSGSLPGITQDIANAIMVLNQQDDCIFMVGDGMVLDQHYNEYLSRAGLTDKTVVYGIGRIRYNKYKHNESVIRVEYNCESKTVYFKDSNNNIMDKRFDIENLEKFTKYSEFASSLDRCMAKECDMAVCLWDGKTKADSNIINLLSILNKPCYVYIVEV